MIISNLFFKEEAVIYFLHGFLKMRMICRCAEINIMEMVWAHVFIFMIYGDLELQVEISVKL